MHIMASLCGAQERWVYLYVLCQHKTGIATCFIGIKTSFIGAVDNSLGFITFKSLFLHFIYVFLLFDGEYVLCEALHVSITIAIITVRDILIRLTTAFFNHLIVF